MSKKHVTMTEAIDEAVNESNKPEAPDLVILNGATKLVEAVTESPQTPMFPKEERLHNLKTRVPELRKRALANLKEAAEKAKVFKAVAAFSEHLEATNEYEALEQTINVAQKAAGEISRRLADATGNLEDADTFQSELSDLLNERDGYVVHKEGEGDLGELGGASERETDSQTAAAH